MHMRNGTTKNLRENRKKNKASYFVIWSDFRKWVEQSQSIFGIILYRFQNSRNPEKKSFVMLIPDKYSVSYDANGR